MLGEQGAIARMLMLCLIARRRVLRRMDGVNGNKG
jgi:hypothetical protein